MNKNFSKCYNELNFNFRVIIWIFLKGRFWKFVRRKRRRTHLRSFQKVSAGVRIGKRYLCRLSELAHLSVRWFIFHRYNLQRDGVWAGGGPFPYHFTRTDEGAHLHIILLVLEFTFLLSFLFRILNLIQNACVLFSSRIFYRITSKGRRQWPVG